MLKITFFIVKNSEDKPNEIFFQDNKNSLLNYRNNKFFFDWKYNCSIEIDVNYENIQFDELFYKKLIEIKNQSIKEAEKISKGKIGNECIKGSIDGLIFSQVQKCYYETPKSIFYFSAKLFIKILMEHKLYDGNKRLAISFLISLLRFLGYHLSWSTGIMKNYQSYESKLEIFVKKLHNGYNENDILYIANWIKSNSIIV